MSTLAPPGLVPSVALRPCLSVFRSQRCPPTAGDLGRFPSEARSPYLRRGREHPANEGTQG